MMHKRPLKSDPKERSMRKTLLFFVIIGAAVSCLRDPDVDNAGTREMSVQQYVALLQSGKFDAGDIPVFAISDIPELFTHVRDVRKLTFYPWKNPMSSRFRQETETTVGMVVLWTIEGTRLDVDHPSEAPTVIDKTYFRQISQSVVVDLYEQWWEKNGGKTARELKEISPLEGTNLVWY